MRVAHIVHGVTLAPRPWWDAWREQRAPEDRAGADFNTLACRDLLTLRPQWRHEVFLVGNDAARDRAAALGLPSHHLVTPAIGNLASAARRAEETLRSRGHFDAAVCWGGALGRFLVHELECSATITVDGVRGCIVPAVSLSSPPKPSGLRAHVTATTQHPISLRTSALHTPDHRPAVRAALGISDTETVVALLGDPPSTAQTERLTFALGILNVAGIPTVGLLARGGRAERRTLRHVREGGYQRRVLVVEGSIDSVLVGADVALLASDPNDAPWTLRAAALRAAASGVAVVAEPALASSLGLLSVRGVCVAPTHGSAALAREALRLLRTPADRAACFAFPPAEGPSTAELVAEAVESAHGRAAAVGALTATGAAR